MKKRNWNNPVTWKQIFMLNIVGGIMAVVVMFASLISYSQYCERIKNAWSGFRNKKSEEENN